LNEFVCYSDFHTAKLRKTFHKTAGVRVFFGKIAPKGAIFAIFITKVARGRIFFRTFATKKGNLSGGFPTGNNITN